MFNDFRDDIPPIRQPRKAKIKQVQPETKHDLRKLYYQARQVMFTREYPGSEYFDNKMPDVSSTNGTTRYIEDVLNNLGHHAERVNTGGIWTPKGWRRSGSTKGSPDIHCIVNDTPWKIELKKGRDDLSKAQLKYRDKMNRIGVNHTVLYVGDLDLFWDEFYKITNQ